MRIEQGVNLGLKEYPNFGSDIVVVQQTIDGSLGGDIVDISSGKILLVDGTSMGVDAKRKEAILLLREIQQNGPVADRGVFQTIDIGSHTYHFNGRGGGFFVFFNEEDDKSLRAVPVYIGADSANAKLMTLKPSSLHKPRFGVSMSDGGLDLLLDERIVSGSFDHDITIKIDRLMDNGRFLGAQERLIEALKKVTVELQGFGIRRIKESFHEYFLYNNQGDRRLTDDATVVIFEIPK